MRFHIPSFKPLLDEIKEYVKEKQGDERYVLLDIEGKDKCYALLWGYEGATDAIITAIKVEFDNLYIEIDDAWSDVTDFDIYTLQTLMNIANTIEDILEEE